MLSLNFHQPFSIKFPKNDSFLPKIPFYVYIVTE
jgi:hypothetical protein